MAKVNTSWCRVFILMYDCFYFRFEPTPFNFLAQSLDVYSCLGKTSYFSRHGFLLFNVNLPPPVREIILNSSARAQSYLPLWLHQHATHKLSSVSSIWICRFFTTFLTCTFFLTLGISFSADTYPRSNLHETILLRQAFCALLNDRCLGEMVIMIDFEP